MIGAIFNGEPRCVAEGTRSIQRLRNKWDRFMIGGSVRRRRARKTETE